MSYFVYTYNYITLHKAIMYAELEWGIENTYIIYSTSIIDAPKALKNNKYNNCVIDPRKYKNIRNSIIEIPIISALVHEKRIVEGIIGYINEQEPDINQTISVVVFRDVALRESLLIKDIKQIYKSVEVIMVEEGLGVYKNTNKPSVSLKTLVKKTIYHILGLPTIYLDELPHGSNPLTDQIICSHPEKLNSTNQTNGKKIIKQINVFNKDYCDYFIREVMMVEITQKNYAFVFLTQPLFPTDKPKVNDKYDKFLNHLFKLLSYYGNVVIKPHPLDQWDYDKYESESINMCPKELSKIAFELLFGYFGNPRALTFYSSAACNIQSKEPGIFLYDFFPEIIDKDIFTKESFNDNNVIRCRSFEELEDVLNYSEMTFGGDF